VSGDESLEGIGVEARVERTGKDVIVWILTPL
jgi:hypothetical protein